MIKCRKKGISAFQPDWAQEAERATKYFQHGGKAHIESGRHELALQKAIKAHIPDPKEARDFMSAVLASNAGLLRYSCPSSRVVWAEALITEFIAAEVKGPIFNLTLILRDFVGSTGLPNGLEPAKLLTMTKLVELILRNTGYSALGHSEYAIFPKKKRGNGYIGHAHAQLLVWGQGKLPLARLLDPVFANLKDGTYGYYAEEITRTPAHALSYAIKTSAYGYSDWPKAAGGRRHESVELPLLAHFQFVHVARRITWPQLCIAVGQGVEIRGRALKNARAKFPVASCRPADNLHTKAAIPKPGTSGVLTPQTEIAEHYKAHGVNTDLRIQAGEAAEHFGEYEAQSKGAKSALYRFLASIYSFSLTSNLRKVELEEVATELKLPFNSKTDLFAFGIRIALHKKKLDRRLVSEWSRALRYLYGTGCAIGDAEIALADYGIKASARNAGPASPGKSSVSIKEDWKKLRDRGNGFVMEGEIPDDLPRFSVMFGSANENRTKLRVRHAISIKSPRIRKLIKEIAKELEKEG